LPLSFRTMDEVKGLHYQWQMISVAGPKGHFSHESNGLCNVYHPVLVYGREGTCRHNFHRSCDVVTSELREKASINTSAPLARWKASSRTCRMLVISSLIPALVQEPRPLPV
jgi:hypothetical protein